MFGHLPILRFWCDVRAVPLNLAALKKKKKKKGSVVFRVVDQAERRAVPGVTVSVLGSASEVEGRGDSGFFSWDSWMGTAIWLRSMVCCRGLTSVFSFTAGREKGGVLDQSVSSAVRVYSSP